MINKYQSEYKTQRQKHKAANELAGNAAALICGLAFIAALLYGLLAGIKRAEVAECYKWQRWTLDYPLYSLMDSKRAQCAAFGLIIK